MGYEPASSEYEAIRIAVRIAADPYLIPQTYSNKTGSTLESTLDRCQVAWLLNNSLDGNSSHFLVGMASVATLDYTSASDVQQYWMHKLASDELAKLTGPATPEPIVIMDEQNIKDGLSRVGKAIAKCGFGVDDFNKAVRAAETDGNKVESAVGNRASQWVDDNSASGTRDQLLEKATALGLID